MRTDDDRNDRMSQGGSTSSGQADLSRASEQSAAREAPADSGASEGLTEQAGAPADEPPPADDGDAREARPADTDEAADTSASPTSSPPSPGPQSNAGEETAVSADGEARAQARTGDEGRDQEQDLVIRYDLQMTAQTGREPQVYAADTQPVAEPATTAAAVSSAAAAPGWTDLQSRMDSLSSRIDDMAGRSDDEEPPGSDGSLAGGPDIDAVLDDFRDRLSDPVDTNDADGGLDAFRAEASDLLDRWNSDDQVADLLAQLRGGSTDSNEDEFSDGPDFTEASPFPAVFQDSGFSDATPPTNAWMSRLFEPGDAMETSGLFLSGSSALSDRADDLAATLNDDDPQDVMNLPSASPVTDLGDGFTLWDGLDLGG